MFKKSHLLVIALIVMISSMFVGCSGNETKGISGDAQSSQTNAVKEEGNSITVAIKENLINMDPHDTNDTLSYSAQKTMMQGLVGFNKDMEIIPVLAKDYECSDDAKVFTFKLRTGVKFHDGTDFNAEVVKVNIDRLSNPENRLKRHSLFALVEKTEVIDEYTVQVSLKEPFGAMINNFAHPAAMIHSSMALEKYGEEVSRHPVGTGPFKFVEWVPGDHLIVEKNLDYWKDGFPKIDGIIFKPVPENGSRVAMLQTGEADYIFPVPTEQMEAINGKYGIVLESEPSIIVRYISMNTMKKPYDDIRVRKAINYAINKEAFIKVVYNGYANRVDSIIAPDTQFYSQQDVYPYDVEKAKQLLKDAGLKDGFEANIWGGNDSDSIKAMEFIQQQLSQVGIKVNVIPIESGTATEKIWSVQNPEDAEIQLFYSGWSPSTGDADWGIRPLLGGDSFPPHSYNTAYYKNEEVDKFITEGLQTSDLEKRRVAYEKVQKILWNDVPWVALCVVQNTAGRKAYLEEVYLLPDGSLSINDAEIKR